MKSLLLELENHLVSCKLQCSCTVDKRFPGIRCFKVHDEHEGYFSCIFCLLYTPGLYMGTFLVLPGFCSQANRCSRSMANAPGLVIFLDFLFWQFLNLKMSIMCVSYSCLLSLSGHLELHKSSCFGGKAQCEW